MDEIGEITDYIQNKAGFEADLIWGNGADENLGNQISVTVIATGFSTSSIPEMITNQKQPRETHVLTETGKGSGTRITPQAAPTDSGRGTAEKQRSYEFNISSHQQTQSDYDLLYPKTAKEQESPRKESKMKLDFSHMTDDDVDQLEKVPAYIRKQMMANEQSHLKPSDYSNYSVSPDPKKKVIFRENNPYIHKNID